MFIGHYGVGLAARKAAPVSLGLLFLAVQFLDLLWPTLLLLNIEHAEITAQPDAVTPIRFTHYPYSHSLVMALVWSVLFGAIYWVFKKNRKHALVLGLCVFSHWLLDFIVHLPDLPLYIGDGSPKVGLQLWKSPLATAVVEGALFIIGLVLYLKNTTANNAIGAYGFWLLIVLLVIVHIANIFSPPPPSIGAVAWGAQGMWLFVLLAFWVDKNRAAVLTKSERKTIL
jgi:hypothetical protein